jgi:hypothetical protein
MVSREERGRREEGGEGEEGEEGGRREEGGEGGGGGWRASRVEGGGQVGWRVNKPSCGCFFRLLTRASFLSKQGNQFPYFEGQETPEIIVEGRRSALL